MKFLLNEKIYLPIIYIVLGITAYIIIQNIIKRISSKIKANKVIDKRKNTIVSLIYQYQCYIQR